MEGPASYDVLIIRRSNENIARMRIGMEKAVRKNLLDEIRHQSLGDVTPLANRVIRM